MVADRGKWDAKKSIKNESLSEARPLDGEILRCDFCCVESFDVDEQLGEPNSEGILKESIGLHC